MTSCADPVVNDDRVDEVLAIVRVVMSRPELGADDDVLDHGGTSLSVVRILAGVRELGLDVQPRDLEGSVTARRVARIAR